MKICKYLFILLYIFNYQSLYCQNSPEEIYSRVRVKDKKLSNKSTFASRTRPNLINATAVDTLSFQTSSRDTVYNIFLKGNLDWENTYTHYNTDIEINFQPNIKITLENVGENLIVNPKIFQEGRNFYTLDSITKSFTKGYQTDLDQLFLIWNNVRKTSYHSAPLFINNELHDVVKYFNSYGMGLCDDIAQSLIPIYNTSKLNGQLQGVHPYNRDLNGHYMAESSYNNKNRFMDPDIEVFYLDRENELPLSADEIVDDHDLARREAVYGNLFEGWKWSEFVASLFGKDDYVSDREYPNHKMDFILRPGERLIYKWDNIGKYPKQFKNYDIEPPYYGNSKFIYVPKFKEPSISESILENHNITFDPINNRISSSKDSGAISFDFKYPYAIVGGTIKGRYSFKTENEAIILQMQTPKNQYFEIARFDGKGEKSFSISLDSYLHDFKNRPFYNYQVRIVLLNKNSGSYDTPNLGNLSFETDIMCWPLSLPHLQLGENKIRVTHESENDAKLKVRHIYGQNDSYSRPQKPILKYPIDNSIINDSIPIFVWDQVESCKRYHIQLSLRDDFLIPYRPSFDIIIDSLQWGVPFLGMFSPDTAYYWRVRAQDDNQVWSEWSDINVFKWKGPRVPLNVAVSQHKVDKNKLILTWKPNHRGERAVKYEIYAANEKGFKASKVPYSSYLGELKEPNLLTTTADTFLVLNDLNSYQNAPLHAYYRVIAIDTEGTPSGSSNYAEIERPYLQTNYPRILYIKDSFNLKLNYVKSLGDLQYRYSTPPIDYWDKEDYSIEMVNIPDWLYFDVENNIINGSPSHSGRFDFKFDLVSNLNSKKLVVDDYIHVSDTLNVLFHSINSQKKLKLSPKIIYFFKGEYIYLEVPYSSGYSYGWVNNSNHEIGDKNYFFAKEEDSYRCIIKNSVEEFETIETKLIQLKSTPKIQSSSKSLQCLNDSITIKVNFEELNKIEYTDIVWYKDFEKIDSAKKSINISMPGRYYYAINYNEHVRAYSEAMDVTFNPSYYENIDVLFNDDDSKLSAPENFQIYRWYKNGILVLETEDNNLDLLGEGDYSLEVVDNNGCTSEKVKIFIKTSNTVVLDHLFFINETKELVLKKNHLYKELRDSYDLLIINSNGQIKNKQKGYFHNEEERYDLSYLSSGIYIVIVSFNNGKTLKLKFNIW